MEKNEKGHRFRFQKCGLSTVLGSPVCAPCERQARVL